MKGIIRKIIFDETVEIYKQAVKIVNAIPEIEGLRCHEVTRVVGHLLDLKVVDGKVGVVEHSFIPIKQKDGSIIILDCYTPGRYPMIQLVDEIIPRLYHQGSPRNDIDQVQIIKILEYLKNIINL